MYFNESLSGWSSVVDIGEEIGSLENLEDLGTVSQISSKMLVDSVEKLSKSFTEHEVSFPLRKKSKIWYSCHSSSLDIYKTNRMS